MKTPRSILVVGGDGMIGAALAARLRAGGVEAPATSRRPAGDSLFLDLARPDSWPPLPRTDAAVICAAVAGLAACERDPEGSRRVNVAGPVALARRLADRGVFTLFLSSDKVFDGTAPHRRRDDPPAPATAYGRHKAEAESGICGGGETAVLRLTKVLAPDAGLAAEWRTALTRGHTIAPFADLWFAPVAVRLAVETIIRIVADRRPGLYHLSGREDRTYADFARHLADLAGADRDLVRPTAAPAAPMPRPRFTSLDMALETERWGLSPPGLDETVRELAGGRP